MDFDRHMNWEPYDGSMICIIASSIGQVSCQKVEYDDPGSGIHIWKKNSKMMYTGPHKLRPRLIKDPFNIDRKNNFHPLTENNHIKNPAIESSLIYRLHQKSRLVGMSVYPSDVVMDGLWIHKNVKRGI